MSKYVFNEVHGSSKKKTSHHYSSLDSFKDADETDERSVMIRDSEAALDQLWELLGFEPAPPIFAC